MHLIYFIYFIFVWCFCIMRSYVLMPGSKSFLSMWGVGVRWSKDLPQQDKKLFAVVSFFSAPFVGIFAPSRAPLYIFWGFMVLLWCFRAGKWRWHSQLSMHAGAVGAVLCSPSRAAGSFWGWVTGKQAPCHHGLSLKSVTKPQLPFPSPFYCQEHVSSRK